MIKRFLLYGITGWCMEIIWTGLGSALQGDLRLASHTYLWMFLIYGLAVFLETLHDAIRECSWQVRGLIWMIVIVSLEYFTGFLLDTIVGACPWDYSKNAPLSLYGYIRLDYFPVWFMAGLLFERLHDFLTPKRVY